MNSFASIIVIVTIVLLSGISRSVADDDSPIYRDRLAIAVLEKVSDPDGAKHPKGRSGHRGQTPFPKQSCCHGISAVRLVQTQASQGETKEEAATRIAAMEQIADHALVTPVLNSAPLPEYDYDRLDYGMTIGIERTPQGRLWACWVAGGDSPEAFFVLATSDDDGESWSKPRLVIDTHAKDLPRPRSVLVGNLWTDPKGRFVVNL